MAGEDAYDYGPICFDFRQKCAACGKQIQFIGGQRVVPDCGHQAPSVGVEVGDAG